MAKSPRRIDPRVEIGRVHLAVGDLDRAVAFYEAALGFELVHRIGRSAAFLGAVRDRPQIGLNTWTLLRGGAPDADGATRVSIRYPTAASLAEAWRHLLAVNVPIERAVSQGISHALYVRDPDGHVIELYCDRSRDEWPHDEDQAARLAAEPLDVDALAEAAERPDPAPAGTTDAHRSELSEATRSMLRDMRTRLLGLHKVLLEDAKVAYELDRGKVGSNTNLLQLVISDPWFAWLHPLSELVVRIDETLQADAPATEADGAVLLDQVARLLSRDRAPADFSSRYYEALQRQPAVVVAHAEVRRILKPTK